MARSETIAFSGQIQFHALKLYSNKGLVVDLDDYLTEINIIEDVFSPFLHGQIQLSDSLNLISGFPIIGEEYLYVKMSTPSMESFIWKTFRVYAVTDKMTVRDNNTQIYTLHFCSQEAITDMLTPLYKPYEGKISDIVAQIYTENLETPRSIEVEENKQFTVSSDDTTPLFILNETSNSAKFISPGWTPAKCINWLASKAIPTKGAGCNYMFWETTQGFCFGNVEKILADSDETGTIAGRYFYFPPGNLKYHEEVRKMFIAEEFEVAKTVDGLENYTNGYLGNRITYADLYKKTYNVRDFDYVSSYRDYKHMQSDASVPLFLESSLRNPATHIKYATTNKNLFTDFPNNVNEKYPEVYPNRKSLMHELDAFKINITVPGRTDLEAGALIDFVYPDTEQKDNPNENAADTHYSGIYMIAAIRHKINLKRHMMIMELVKDSFNSKKK